MKRTLLILCALLAMAYSAGTQAQNVWDGTVAGSFAGGNGTAEDPYLIADGAQLARFASMVNSGQTGINGRLTADILLNDTTGWENWGNTAPANSWTPIGNNSQPFTGTLDGDGHSVSGIYINSTADYQGLVGYLDNGGTLQNLGVKASYIKGGSYVGGVCGENQGTVTNCYNSGSVTGVYRVGGLCGDNYYGTQNNCYNTGSVSGNRYVGGVCGDNYGGTMTNCYYTGSVTGSYYVGGLCGDNYFGTVTNCYYLNTCGAAGVGTSKTADEFASGEVAWLLSTGENGEIWGQNLTFDPKDDYPVLGGLKVYNNNGTYSNMATDGDFYLISTADELRLFASMVNSGQTSINGRLTADIVLNDTTNWTSWNESTAPANTWTPIGNSWENLFTGILDGDGHSVSGIYINSTADDQGLVGVLGEGGTLQDLGVKASYIKGGYSVGGLCGRNDGTVSNCYNIGSVEGNNSVGGLCGQNYATVTNCYNTGNVTGNDHVGGVCGWNDIGSITNCYNTGSVAGNGYVGGVCGTNNDTMSNCYYIDTCGAAGEGTSKTAEQFQSGEVAWLLSTGENGEIWGQNISFDPKDSYPVPGGLKVYNNNGTYSNMAMDDDFYLISNADELRLFASMVNSGQTSINGRLTADIVLNDTKDWESWETTAPANSWTPIGSYENPFTGTLDGDGHSVSGIYINSEADNQGLVGVLEEGGTLQDLGVKASYIKGGYSVGGLCGQNYATVTNCYNSGSVAGNNQVGGVCGWNDIGSITNCYNTGSVAGNGYVGGLCGLNYGTVTNCYNTGSVEGNNSVGGLCGWNDGTVTNCYNTGNVTGTGDYVGGLCGWNDGTVTNCYNTGNVTGNNSVGGLCGYNWGTVTNCYNTGSVEGNYSVGGLCGQNSATVTNCYYLTGMAAGGINGSDAAGQAEAKTETEFASGEVAWLLQGEKAEQVWGQAIGTDESPVWQTEGNKVYKLTLQNGEEANPLYANSGNFTLPAPAEREGYTFAGWFTAQADGTQVQDDATLTADLTLYAQWTANSYTIRFVNADGTVLQSSEVEYGQTPAYNGETPTKESTAEFDYTFAGWTPQIANVTEEATYKATYTATKRSYTLTVALAEGCEEMGEVSGSGSYEYGTVVTLTAIAHEGYKFMQWSDGDTNATRIIIVEGEVTLTATFEAEGGSETGLEEQMADTFQVIGMERSMRIEGSEQEACVFNTAGQLIYRGTERIIEVHAAGIYLVRIGNETKRVMVR